MPKNYYIILGVARNSTQDQIKTAFRRLAKRYHPDHYGSESAPFRVVREAYSVLSDPQRRKDYDRDLERRAGKGKQRVQVEPLRRQHSTAEPLAPAGRPGSSWRRRAAVEPFDFYRPAWDSPFDRFFGDLREFGDSFEERSRNMEVTIHLDSGQLGAGGQVEIVIPVEAACPSCTGIQGSRLYGCWRCSGSGRLQGEIPVLISYPPHLPDGHTLRYPLARLGLPGYCLDIHFRLRRPCHL